MSPSDQDQDHILVVDDQEDIREILTSMLTRRGYRVQVAMDGYSALQLAQESPPDLILLDIVMPDIAGYEVCEQLKADERTQDVPVIFISGLHEVEDKLRAFAAGGVDYVTKPLRMREVLARVKTHVALRRMQRQLEQQNRQLEQEIAERRQAERALQESEARWRALVENAPERIVTMDLEGTILFTNRTTTDQSAEWVAGTNVYDYLPPDEQDRLRNALASILQSKEPQKYESHVVRADGTSLWYENSVALVEHGGQLAAAILIATDITAHKETEQALREAKEVAEAARMEEKKRWWEAEQRRLIAEGLGDVLAMLNTNQPLDKVLDLIARQAGRLLNSPAVGIYSLGEADKEWILRAIHGPQDGELALEDLTSAQEVLRQVKASRQTVAIPDIVAVRAHGSDPATHTDERFQALLVVPILSQDRIYGAMLLHYAEPHTFDDEEIELATVFGDQAALAIENDRLREQVGEAAATAERHRLARDLHDAVTQTLFSASLIAEALPRIWQNRPEEARNGLEELCLLTRGALAEMRALLLELRPAALTEKPLGQILHDLTEAMTSRTRIPINLTVEGASTLSPDLQVALYRITQEALNNVIKHAGASRVDVSLHCQTHEVFLEIRDDGRGFNPEVVLPDQLGLRIMRERAERAGATLEVWSRPEQGTKITAKWADTSGR